MSEDPKIPTPEELQAQLRRAVEKQVRQHIKFAKQVQRRSRGTKHAPGETKTPRDLRVQKSRKANKAAAKSRRANR